MKGELLVAEARHLLEQHDAKNLLRAHARPSLLEMRQTTDEVFVHIACGLGNAVEDAAHLDQLARVQMLENWRDKRQLRG